MVSAHNNCGAYMEELIDVREAEEVYNNQQSCQTYVCERDIIY